MPIRAADAHAAILTLTLRVTIAAIFMTYGRREDAKCFNAAGQFPGSLPSGDTARPFFAAACVIFHYGRKISPVYASRPLGPPPLLFPFNDAADEFNA